MKTLKIIALILSLLICLSMAGCKGDADTDTQSLFDGNVMYAPPGLDDDRTDHVREPSVTLPDAKDTEDTEDTTADRTESTKPPYITDTDITDTPVGTDTKPIPDTDKPSDETTDSEERPPVTIKPESEYTVIDMSETLAPDFPVSGRFTSTENPRLALAVNYECSINMDGEVTVTLDVGLLAHAIHCGGRPSTMGELTIDGTTYNFSTAAISNDSSAQIYVPFVTRTYTVGAYKSSTTVDASWMFNGSYGGEDITALTASVKFIW